MNILRETNTIYDLNTLPDEIDFDLRYCVLDYSNQNDVDICWQSLMFIDRYPNPVADLQIGPYRVQMPMDWSIVIADKNFGYMEILELKDLRERPFDAFIINPITGFMPDFGEIVHVNIFPNVTWNLPKLKYGHILAVPLERKPNPPCAWFVRDIHRIPESLDITKIFS